MVSEIESNPPMIVRLMKKRFEAGEPVFLRLGKLRYHLVELKVAMAFKGIPMRGLRGEHWVGRFASMSSWAGISRRFYSDADTLWTIKKAPEGWDVQERPKVLNQVDEARRRKAPMSEPLGMKAELILKVLQREFDKERGVQVKINIFGRGLSGTLSKAVRNGDNSVTLYADLPPDPTGEVWSSVMTVTNSDFEELQLTKKDGELKLLSTNYMREEEHKDPIFLTMLRRLLNAGKTVYATAPDENGKDFRALVKDVQFDDHFNTIDIDAEIEGSTETDQFGYTQEEAEDLTLKNEGGVWRIIDRKGNYR